MTTTRIHWPTVVAEAARIADSYSFAPTLRQVYYRLVAAEILPNTGSAYKRLSSLTAEARRAGTCPPFADGTRSIERAPSWTSPQSLLRAAASQYRRDRTEGQDEQLVVGLEKATLSVLARQVADEFGIPVVALRGYGSQTIIDDLSEQLDRDGREARIFYVGDFDPTGLDIERDLLDRLSVPVTFERLAVTWAQVEDLDLPAAPAKLTDSRTASMLASEGVAVQVEAEAIEPGSLQTMIRDAIEGRTDLDELEAVLDRESAERARLHELARSA